MLYLIAWLTDFAAVLFIFVGTRLLAEQGAGDSTLGWMGTMFFLSSAISSAWSGQLSDRRGRRRVTSCGMICLVASLIVAIPSESHRWLFFVAYTAVGVSLGMIYPPVIACLGRGGKRRAASRDYLFFCLSFNLGILCAQLIGGWMFERKDYRWPIMVAIAAAVTGLIVSRFLPIAPANKPSDTNPEPASAPNLASASKFASDMDESNERRDLTNHVTAQLGRALARLTWIANFGGMFSMSLLWFLFPQLMVNIGVPADQHGRVLAVGRATVMGTFCLMYFIPLWEFRFRFAMVTQLCGIAGLTLLSVSEGTTGLGLGVVGVSLMMGYTYFSSLFYNAVGNPPDRKGRAFGLNEACLCVGAAGGSCLGGYLGADWGARAPFQVAAALVVGLLLVQFLLFWRHVQPLQLQHDIDAQETTATFDAASR